MEARRDAALMELEYANLRMASSADVEVSWWDRFRYGSTSTGLIIALYSVVVLINMRSAFDPDKFWLLEVLEGLLWIPMGVLAISRVLKTEKQEELTKARVMYREAVESGADLRGAFSLVTTHSGDLEMKDERARAREGVVLDLEGERVREESVTTK